MTLATSGTWLLSVAVAHTAAAVRAVGHLGLGASLALAPGAGADQAPGPAGAGVRETVQAGWTAPLPSGVLLHPFAPGPLPWSPGHRGVDLAARLPTVVAPAAGTVTFAGVVAGVPVVVIAHGAGLRSTLLPVRALLPRGAMVRSGQAVGVVTPAPAAASTAHLGCPRGAECLHWGLLRGQTYLDPWRMLRPTVVRLVPDVGPLS